MTARYYDDKDMFDNYGYFTWKFSNPPAEGMELKK